MAATPALAIEERLAARLAPVLEDEHIALDPEAVARALLQASGHGGGPLTAAERAFLDDHAGVDAPADPDQAYLNIALHAPAEPALLSTAAAAEILGAARTTVTRLAGRGKLFAIESDGQLWFPTWQFRDGVALPGLDRALADVPSGWGLGRLERFMTTPDETLDELSPLAWLAEKSDPAAVAQLLADESRE